MNDLPLPPPPSPTQLQQYELYNNNSINNNDSQHSRTLSSLSSMSTGSNTTHSSTQSLSPTPYNYNNSNTILQQQHQQQQKHQMTHFQPHNESTNSSLSLDQYSSTSPLHSRQASSSSSSLNYGCNNDNYGIIATIPPPPPPPLPEDNNQDLYINTMKHQHNANNRKLLMTKQNENDMNTYNKTNVSTLSQPAVAATNTQEGGGAGAVAGPTPLIPTTQKVYNKFLKEYSNKLLTQGNSNSSNNSNHNNNTNPNLNTLKHSDNASNIHSFINNGTPKPFIASPNPNTKQTQQQHNHYLQQQQTNNNIINNSLPGVAAITATLNNQLKFDSCQVAPPLLPTTTAITPSSSNLSILDKSPFNNSSNSQITNDNCKTNSNSTTTNTTTNEMSSTVATGPTGDKPFEYVTLTGNVIRSVVPPGKGNVNYKVNQGGYARPYGAVPPAAAPKSPVTYPPQPQQQWNQPPPTQPKPSVGNAYATLPRSNVGQQGAAGYKPPQATNITANTQSQSAAAAAPAPTASKTPNVTAPSNNSNNNDSTTGGVAPKGGAYGATSAPKRGHGILNKAVSPGVRVPLCNSCGTHIRGPFITALGKIWCPEHFHCVNGNCRRPLQDIGFVEEKGDLYCEYCFEKYLAPTCSKCSGKIKGDCLNAIGKHFHPECFACGHCGKLFGNTPFFLEDGMPYCEADWNELFTTKCFACGFPVEAGDRWVEALNHNYHSQCFNCTYCKQNLEGQSFYNKGGRPFCKNHAR